MPMKKKDRKDNLNIQWPLMNIGYKNLKSKKEEVEKISGLQIDMARDR